MSDLQLETIAQRQQCVPLGPWLEAAARVEQIKGPWSYRWIPARFSEPFLVREILAFDQQAAESTGLRAAFEWLDAQERFPDPWSARLVARWECCAGSNLKQARKLGRWDESLRRLEWDDPRVSDCTVGLATRVCVRPWIQPQYLGGYPVEYRVFFDPAQGYAISSYYPQRPLPVTAETFWHLQQILSHAEWLVRERFGKKPLPCTLDFLVDHEDRVWFLEGGPPHIVCPLVSAHPCCFAPGQVQGIALAAQPGACR